MRRKIRIIVTISIIAIILLIYEYRQNLLKEYSTRKEINKEHVIEVQIIDEYDQINKLYENPKEEEYVEADIIIDGNYYSNVGIRTKGDVIYNILHEFNLDNYSFKVKLDYKNKEQKYNGMNELHLNTTYYDPTGMREFLVYDIYNQMGIETQQYYFGHLHIGDTDRGLITIVEVINENYLEHYYKSKEGNLYKPSPVTKIDYSGADLRYYGNSKENYKGIFDNVKTARTKEDDENRLIQIIQNINFTSRSEIIEDNFVDFDKIIKMVAINKVLFNVDVFTSHTLRNYYIYEEMGKIDILTFDFDISMNPTINLNYWKDKMDEFDLSKSDIRIYSRIIELIIENKEYNQKYYQYVEETQQLLKNIKIEEKIDEIYKRTKEAIKANEKKIYTYEEYEENIKILKDFIIKREKAYETH